MGYEWRQVFDIDISRFVTEYRAEILIDEKGNRYVASFPDSVSAPVQYGTGVKANAIYMSNYQLIPYNRIEDHFADQFGLPLSAGTVFNFNKDAYSRLQEFELWLKKQLRNEPVVHADETGIKMGNDKYWIHCVSSSALTYFMPHTKRGGEAMVEMGVLPGFAGMLVRDHWKSYYQFLLCLHILCNAHHLRELERAWEQDGMQWAKKMQELLLEINKAVDDAGGVLNHTEAEEFRHRYRSLLNEAEIESPPPDERQRKKGQRSEIPSFSKRLIKQWVARTHKE